MKRLLAFVLVLACLLLLAACTDETIDTNAPSGTVPGVQAPEGNAGAGNSQSGASEPGKTSADPGTTIPGPETPEETQKPYIEPETLEIDDGEIGYQIGESNGAGVVGGN